jgi:hypothetical protein
MATGDVLDFAAKTRPKRLKRYNWRSNGEESD